MCCSQDDAWPRSAEWWLFFLMTSSRFTTLPAVKFRTQCWRDQLRESPSFREKSGTRGTRPSKLCIAVLALALFAGTAQSGTVTDWPQFRGPGGLGVADNPNLPERWSTNENVAWKIE